MSEQKLLFIDIDVDSKSSVEGRVHKPLWNCSDNSFRFNFFSDSTPPPQEEVSNLTEAFPARVSFTGQDLGFAFNFQIPPAEDMDTANTSDSSHQQSVQEEDNNPPEASVQSKTKKKKKPKKKTASGDKPQQEVVEGIQRDEELSAEEQLNRQLDWCIEHLEQGLRSQKGTPKQKDEASRALKTLRSSKAPLVKKRQVMRNVAGDYRKKMEEEKIKQFKLIQNEIASAQVKLVSDSPKKFVFHRKAEIKTQPAASEDQLPQTKPQDDKESNSQTQQTFVFVPSKEEFCFNFF